jgi:DNA-directed RNA polymerase specialized sigma24 family protein/CheY-like chemotaxis protein
MNSQDIARQTLHLRQYARALIGSQEAGDDFVQATLEALLEGRVALDPGLSARTALFKAFHGVWRRSLNGHSIDAAHHVVDRRLRSLTPEHRTALLLMRMEGFTLAEAAAILQVPESVAAERFEMAERDIQRQLATNVLIIEDEPIVALDLDRLISGLGHKVVGVAATQSEARAMVHDRSIGLVLADVRLADGSSGLDAASDILRTLDVPVIFITAFPERLLTGQRREPAFLISKPFRDDTVRALIGQALFFHEPRAASAAG